MRLCHWAIVVLPWLLKAVRAPGCAAAAPPGSAAVADKLSPWACADSWLPACLLSAMLGLSSQVPPLCTSSGARCGS